MKDMYYTITALNTLLKYIDWLLFVVGLCLFSFSNNGNILSTIIIFLLIVWLGRYFASAIVYITSIPLLIVYSLSSLILNRYNNDNLAKDLTMLHFIMISFSMVSYGMLCTFIFLSQSYNVENFYYIMLFLYIAIMYPSMMIIESNPESNAFTIFGSVWTFFYRIAFGIGLISVAFFNTSIYFIIIIATLIMFIPNIMLLITINLDNNG